MKVISGAQTGADVAGLWAAKLHGLETGGWAPKNFMTLDGPHPEMAETFGIKEHARSYRGRTIENLKSSDLTIICSSVYSAGTRLTADQCKEHGIPFVYIAFDASDLPGSLKSPKIAEAISKIKNLKIEVLNVAGNSTDNSPRAFEFTFKVCELIFAELGISPVNPYTPLDVSRLKDRWSKKVVL